MPQVSNSTLLLASIGFGGVVTIFVVILLWRALDHLAKSHPPDAPPLLPPSAAVSASKLHAALKKFIESDDTMPLLDILSDVSDPVVLDFIAKLEILSREGGSETGKAETAPPVVSNNTVILADSSTPPLGTRVEP